MITVPLLRSNNKITARRLDDRPEHRRQTISDMLLEESDDHLTEKSYTIDDLAVFDSLKHAVWIFDIGRKRMLWANKSALPLWSAASLHELVSRDFALDLTEATELRMKDQQERLYRGETLKEQWTFYPSGKASTCVLTSSAMILESDGRRMVALCETELQDDDKQSFDASTVRGVEMIRHLPLAVSEFTMDGKLTYQNPHAVMLYGTSTNTDSDDFLPRFIDQELGKSALKQVQMGKDYNVECEQYTTTGPRWIAASIRRVRDPVNSENVILYSARDISEVVQARKDTTQANLKTEFVAVIAHEIRTPLHQIVGYVDLLESSSPLSLEQRKQINVVQTSTALLMSIINALLDYNQLENGKLLLENIPFDLIGVLNGCLAAAENDIQSRGLELRRHVPKDIPPKLMGDPNRLRQILLNLLSNARKFTNKGSIGLTVSTVDKDNEHQRIRFEVSDTGVGIDQSAHSLIFEKYQQAHPSVARNYGGTGLGLAICKDLSELMGGKIWLKSDRGKGTSVFVEIPFQTVTAYRSQRDGTVAAEPAPGSLTSCGGDDDNDGDTTARLHVLVVEDNLVNQKMCRSLLQRIGHTVAIADNGQVALDLLRQESSVAFDLVLMDIQMPVMDGIECTKQIRSALGLSQTDLPVVGLTASFQSSDMEYYRDIGMTTCLPKPLRMETLKKTIVGTMRRCAKATQYRRDVLDD